jgi:hypothetical protein
MKFLRIKPSDRSRFQKRVADLETIATYPLGSDSFKIDHGKDYFAFFDRLGQSSDMVHYHAALDGDRVVAVGAGVIRRVPERTWYLCDLKVHPDYRGTHIPLQMLGGAFLPNYLRCARGYSISMNPGDGRPNRIVKLLGRFRWAPIRLATTLKIFSLNATEMQAAEPLLKKHRGAVSYLSLRGIKDIVLSSTRSPMPLLHAQFGPCASQGLDQPQPGSMHMFCAPEGDPLIQELRAAGAEPTASASVIHHRMPHSDWRFILTSDI